MHFYQSFYPSTASVSPPGRAIRGFLLSLVAGILIILNAAFLLSSGFYTFWSGIFPWIPYFGAFPPWMLFIIGIVLAVIVFVGSTLMILGYGAIGAVVVLPAAAISLIFGGGLIAGFVLGIISSILGMLGR